MFIVNQQRKKYTPEYRREAANLVIESQRPIAHVAKEIGVAPGLLGRWVKNERERRGASDGLSEADLRAENARLRRELAEAKMDKDLTPIWWTPDIRPSRAVKKGNLPPCPGTPNSSNAMLWPFPTASTSTYNATLHTNNLTRSFPGIRPGTTPGNNSSHTKETNTTTKNKTPPTQHHLTRAAKSSDLVHETTGNRRGYSRFIECRLAL
ncbi:transposase [Corynebacterium accolens]|uniref:transposase n=1 Tax=Corynebacterium accolens TaxID=38284 RepID=UPI002543CB6C|nr:transposase [Corynebacterium accolens]MDK4280932.1 transposase [Corynebacterium accolens]MDK8820052.1 transposase [Corynebacterium accolens]